MSDNNINNMDIKQLRNEVQLLRDELAIMKRNFEDILYNLDTDNFSQRIVKQGEDMYTKIEQTADKIELQAEKVEENESNIATLQVTAKEISTEVTNVKNDVSTNSSRITQNAESITSEVAARTSADEALSASITQTASDITYTVVKKITVQFEKSSIPTYGNTNSEEKGMLCYCTSNKKYYYFNEFKGEWQEYDARNGINSKFIQTAYGFKFTTDVKIDADLIVEGTIDADRINTDELSCTKLYATATNGGYSTMDANGLIVYDNNDASKVRIGCQKVSGTNYPYIGLGIGSGWGANGRGTILKLGSGIWIGDDSIVNDGGDYPGGSDNATGPLNIGTINRYATGIFIDFERDKIYKYIKGTYTEL